ncbi:hypothetical protein C8J55DRAFT_564834 [Lentinula edodes]|uniref:Uncharacterized protein n=1 Tax=Lentinula lateritia TaxID=40482 RepID=A0A9W9DH16_9AGAR|nr:hypothetical protein C8J55DRAFT_564834 [Lentinula edodes]
MKRCEGPLRLGLALLASNIQEWSEAAPSLRLLFGSGLGGCRRHQRAQRGQLGLRGWAENIDKAPKRGFRVPADDSPAWGTPRRREGSGVRAQSLVHLRDKEILI